MLPPLQGPGCRVSLTPLPTSEMTRLCLEIDEQSGLMLSGLWDGHGCFSAPEQLLRLSGARSQRGERGSIPVNGGGWVT